MSYDPKPRSPERLTMLRDIAGKYDPERGLVIIASFRYDEWCCGEAHEVVDAIATVYNIYDKAINKAINKSHKKARRDYEQDKNNRTNSEQLTLF